MVTETLQYYLFKLFKKISEKVANFYLTLTIIRLVLNKRQKCGKILTEGLLKQGVKK